VCNLKWRRRNRLSIAVSYREREKPVIEFFSFATGKATKLTTLDRPVFTTGISLSPNGRWLLFS